MKNLISLIINKHLVIVRYLLVLVVIVIITTLFPRDNFNYEYELNAPWKYEDLLAPMTFSIKKPEDSLKAEQKRAIESVHPYYKYDPTVYIDVKTKVLERVSLTYVEMAADTNNLLTASDSAHSIAIASMLLDTIYSLGILRIDDSHVNNDGSYGLDKFNLMVEKNTIKQRSLNDCFYNPIHACSYSNIYMKSLEDSNLVHITDIICKNLRSDIKFDEDKTKEIQDYELNIIVPASGKVIQGEAIVTQGQVITADSDQQTYQKLNSLKHIINQGRSSGGKEDHFLNRHKSDIGYFLITGLLFLIFIVFMRIFDYRSLSRLREVTFLLFIILGFVYLVSLVAELQQVSMPTLSLYVLPFCIVPIIVRSFFGSMVAHYVHIIIILISYFILPLSFEFLFLHFIAGLVAIISNEKTYYWSDFFKSIAYIFMTYCIGYLGISLIQETSWENIKFANFGWLFVNTLLTLLAYQLIPICEKIFGFVSSITLAELGDLNRELLKKLSRQTPGTFWHSLQVANLSEAAAYEIGANALLVKVGALYHDIGKMRRPAYFIENQKTAINPHDDLPYEESAHIIIEHVTAGIEMAKKEKLPNIVIDFIRTHHGNTRTEYFYRKYMQQNQGKEIDDKIFRYPGPLPYSKETAIVMMADSVEAASRTLKNPTDDDISNLVDSIIESKIKHNQFVNCDISFKDITVIKKSFKRQLRSIYHTRISYPETKK